MKKAQLVVTYLMQISPCHETDAQLVCTRRPFIMFSGLPTLSYLYITLKTVSQYKGTDCTFTSYLGMGRVVNLSVNVVFSNKKLT